MRNNLSINDSLKFRSINRPVDLQLLHTSYVPQPFNSLLNFRIRTGPFLIPGNAFDFQNSFVMTEENAAQLREKLIVPYSFVINQIVSQFTATMLQVSVNVDPFPFLPSISLGLPGDIVSTVITEVASSLVVDKVIASIPGTMGRCGGMAFAGYDYYLANVEINHSIKTPPSSGVLGDYIFSRLLDSIGINSVAWLDWFITLHVLPIISKSANIVLGAAVGSIGGPLGIALGAFLGDEIGLFNFGGRKVTVDRTIDEWVKIKNMLDMQAACLIGLLFSDSITPLSDHQVLAIDYSDIGDNHPELIVWDNRDGARMRKYKIDFTGDELNIDQVYVTGLSYAEGNPPTPDGAIKGFFLETYMFSSPPIV